MNKKNLILIYQLGKVGSSSLYKTLVDISTGFEVIQLHFLSEKFQNRAFNQERYEWHLGQIKAVENYRDQHPDRKVKVISLVREPVGRNISDLFQNPKYYLDEGQSLQNISVNDLIDKFKKNNSFDYTLNWFDNEFKEYTGIDVYDYPFDKEKGYSIFSANNFEILILQMEALNRVYKTVLSDFLGVSVAQLNLANQSAKKSSGYLASQLKEKITFSQQSLTSVYSSRYVKHFYSEEDINSFTRKWMSA